MNEKHMMDVQDLPMNVFEVVDQGGIAESLTADHGMQDVGAASNCSCYICCGGSID